MTDAPERIWAWASGIQPPEGAFGLWSESDKWKQARGSEYIRKDATFTADDLRRAFAIAVEMAETICLQEHTSWPARATDYACGASDIAGRLKNTIRALTPPDDLPARVKGTRDE